MGAVDLSAREEASERRHTIFLNGLPHELSSPTKIFFLHVSVGTISSLHVTASGRPFFIPDVAIQRGESIRDNSSWMHAIQQFVDACHIIVSPASWASF
jgi:hypothetical protein